MRRHAGSSSHTRLLIAAIVLSLGVVAVPRAQTGSAAVPAPRRDAQAPVFAPSRRATDDPTVVRASTAQLDLVATVSAERAAPGDRLTLTFDVTPGRGMHVYAPGTHDYRVIAFRADAPPWLTVHPMVYPPAEIYHFVPLDERVETYQRPFTLRQDVTIRATPDARGHLAGRSTVVIGGRLDYQACDDVVCYAPASVPVSFTVTLTPRAGPQ